MVEGRMLLIPSTECRAIAEYKLAEAGRDKTHRRRLINAAEGWLFLAGQLRRLEKSFEACAGVTPSSGRPIRRLGSSRRLGLAGGNIISRE
jgi:hypothetical protein